MTERIADCLTRSVIAGSDLVIDLHSAGAAYSMPVELMTMKPARSAPRNQGGQRHHRGHPVEGQCLGVPLGHNVLTHPDRSEAELLAETGDLDDPLQPRRGSQPSKSLK